MKASSAKDYHFDDYEGFKVCQSKEFDAALAHALLTIMEELKRWPGRVDEGRIGGFEGQVTLIKKVFSAKKDRNRSVY